MDETASISPHQLQIDCQSAQPPLVIDVRREAAYLAAPDMISGALRRDPATIESWADELPPAANVVVYCVHGHEVSQGAAHTLIAHGRNARFVEGGIEAWRSQGGALMHKPPAPSGT